jgi:radical SAM protein with 4Fe4S-binding SPASM domain
MLYCQKFDTFIRIYDNIGYITNQSVFNDQIADESGAAFLRALSREPQSLESLIEKIATEFIDADLELIKEYAIEFYNNLETDGFIISGETEEELKEKDKKNRFSYNAFEPKTIKNNFNPVIKRAAVDTYELLENKFRNKPHLFSFQIELTSRCNERCVHCYIPHENKVADIKPELFYDVLDQCKEMGVLSISLSGGEALMHPHFCEFLRKAKDYDFSINILSNLTLLNDEIINEMKENRLSSVQVSLYSMDPREHDSITQVPGSFEKTLEAMLKLIKNDIPLQISCPTMKQNKNSFVKVLKWANEHKIRAITDYIMMARYDHTKDNLDNRLDLQEVSEVINDIIENDKDYQMELQAPDFVQSTTVNRVEEAPCGVAHTSLCMVADGSVYPCPGWQDYVVGNVNKNPLNEIWENSERIQFLRSIRKKDFSKCIDCKDFNFCNMCMVRNFNENRDIFSINEHFCKVAELNHKIVVAWKEKMMGNQKN